MCRKKKKKKKEAEEEEERKPMHKANFDSADFLVFLL